MNARIARLAALFVLALAPVGASAQTLPQSTVDRQTIAQLQYQLSQPGVTPQQRLVIQEHISQLEYQINTRPPIVPPPGAPTPAPLSLPLGNAPFTSRQLPVPGVPVQFGSCDADRGAIEYLTAELRESRLTQQERSYIPNRVKELRADLRARHCAN